MDTTSTTTSRSLTVRPAEATAGEACCEPPMPVPAALGAAQTVTLAERLKALADPTRLRMLELLAGQPRPLCVCDITAQFDQRQPTISHHLRILREAGLVACEKRGVWAYYWATEAGKRGVSTVRDLL
jgi:ArsR family transcriptional regulator, arsenate/arsenite/antimonite-responsive transcriptional repressor